MVHVTDLQVLAVTLSTTVGGTDHSIRNLAKALAPLGIRVTLGAPGGTETEEWWRASSLPFLPLDLPQRIGIRPQGGGSVNPAFDALGQIPRSVRAVSVIRRALRQFDVVHSNHLLVHPDAVAAARLSRTPVVVELHDIVPPGVGRRVLSAVAAASSAVVAVSNPVAQQLQGRAARKAAVVHQGIDMSLFSPGDADDARRATLTAAPQSPLIAAVGRLDPEKKLDVLIDATAQVRRSGIDAHLAIVGAPSEDDGSYQRALVESAARLLPGAHRFVDRTNDVASVLRAVDVLACPSEDEPFGLIALEAQACAVPVVCSDSGGLVDFVSEGRTGLVARTNDAASLASQLTRVLTDRALAGRLVENARRQAEEKFSVEHRARRFAEIYTASARS